MLRDQEEPQFMMDVVPISEEVSSALLIAVGSLRDLSVERPRLPPEAQAGFGFSASQCCTHLLKKTE